IGVATLDLAVLVGQSHRFGTLGYYPVDVARERREGVEVRSARDPVGLLVSEISVLFFVLRREFHDGFGERHRFVGPVRAIETHFIWVAPGSEARTNRHSVPKHDF